MMFQLSGICLNKGTKSGDSSGRSKGDNLMTLAVSAFQSSQHF
jgi:hypothetical protein